MVWDSIYFVSKITRARKQLAATEAHPWEWPLLALFHPKHVSYWNRRKRVVDRGLRGIVGAETRGRCVETPLTECFLVIYHVKFGIRSLWAVSRQLSPLSLDVLKIIFRVHSWGWRPNSTLCDRVPSSSSQCFLLTRDFSPVSFCFILFSKNCLLFWSYHFTAAICFQGQGYGHIVTGVADNGYIHCQSLDSTFWGRAWASLWLWYGNLREHWSLDFLRFSLCRIIVFIPKNKIFLLYIQHLKPVSWTF